MLANPDPVEYRNERAVAPAMAFDISVLPVPGGPSNRLPCCFFFQAEDGIRDVAVTGVQTCALPISTKDEETSMQLHTTALCAALALGGLAAAHADTLAKVRDSGRITLAYRESSVPFSYLDNGKPIGMTVEMSQAVAEAVKKAVNRPDLKVQWQAVTSQNRMP